MRRVLWLSAGWGLVVLGVIGLVLPVLQGLLFLALGGAILSRESPWVNTRLRSLRRRFPRQAARFRAAARSARLQVRRVFGV